MDIGFFFEYEGLVVQLPVNPAEVKVSFSSNNKVEEIVKLGEINMLKNRQLSKITFSSFLPQESWFPAIRTTGEFKDGSFYKDLFEKIMESMKPCRFMITGLNINNLYSIEEFNYEHRAGDHEDAYFDITLKEYRDYKITNTKLDLKTKKDEVKKVEFEPDKARQQLEVTIGSKVNVNGRIHLDSYGAKPGKTLIGYIGRVNLINKKGTHPYHITSPDGGALGWVGKEQVEIV